MTIEELAEHAFGVYKKSLDEARSQKLVMPWDMITPAMRQAFIEAVDFVANEMIHMNADALKNSLVDRGIVRDMEGYMEQQTPNLFPMDELIDNALDNVTRAWAGVEAAPIDPEVVKKIEEYRSDNARFVVWGAENFGSKQPHDILQEIKELLNEGFSVAASGDQWILMVRK